MEANDQEQINLESSQQEPSQQQESVEQPSTDQASSEQPNNNNTEAAVEQDVEMVGIIDNTKQAEEFKNNGNNSYKLGDYKMAVEFYTRAIELVPENASYYANRAAAYMMLRKYREAIGDTSTSTRIDPSYVKAYSREGKLNLLLGDYAAALKCFEKVKELEPKNDTVNVDIQNANAVKSFDEKANESYKKGDYRRVVFLMDSALNHSSDSMHFKIAKAEALALLGRYQEAQEIANDCIFRDQTNVDAIYVRGICLYYQDNADKAFQHFQRVLQFSPDFEKAKSFFKKAKLQQSRKEAGNAAFKEGKFDDALKLYTEALEVDLNNKLFKAVLYTNRATVLAKLNRLQDAIENCNNAIKLDDTYIKAYLRRAKYYLDTEDYEKSVADYEKICQMEKTKENLTALKHAKLELKKSKRKDYYKILGVSKDSSDDEIKKAYRKMALKEHPDRCQDEELKQEKESAFKEIGEAYSTLSDPKKKAAYDSGKDLEDEGCGMRADIDPNLIFQAFFGGGGGGGADGFPFSFGGGGGGSRGGRPGGFSFNMGSH